MDKPELHCQACRECELLIRCLEYRVSQGPEAVMLLAYQISAQDLERLYDFRPPTEGFTCSKLKLTSQAASLN